MPIDVVRLSKKIGNLSLTEIRFRLRRMMQQARDRYFGGGLGDNLHLAQFLILPDRVRAFNADRYLRHWQEKDTFYFSRKNRESILAELTRHHAGELQLLSREADRILGGEIPVFRRRFRFDGPVPWHCDPESGFAWPLRHWSRIKVVDRSSPDPKFTWELNRHQFLLLPAMAYFITREERYAEYIVGQILDWIHGNPVEHGINWVESLEVGTRLVAWIWILELLKGCRCLDGERLTTILISMHQHADHLYKYPSFFISPNTHLTGEALGLFLYAAVYPEDKSSSFWRAFAQRILDTEITHQVGEDGVHKELSTVYHTYTVEYYLQYVLCCRKNGLPLQENVLRLLERMCEFMVIAERPDGTVPLLGDNDGGFALPLAPEKTLSWKHIMCIASAFFHRADFKHRSPTLSWSAVWLLDEGLMNVFNEMVAKEPENVSGFFREANYIFWRRDWEDDADYLCFDAGKMGFLSAGHSHADFLHFEYSVNGWPCVIDIGCCSYADAFWRSYSRSTRAHNTIVINGKDQGVPSGSFSWAELPNSGNGYLEQGEGYTMIGGRYVDLDDVVHNRYLLLLAGGYLLCLDRIVGIGVREIECNLHFSPDLAVVEKHGTLYLSHGKEQKLKIVPLGFPNRGIRLYQGLDHSGKGSVFPDYGQVMQSCTLSIADSVSSEDVRGLLFIPDRDLSADPVSPFFSCEREVEDGMLQLESGTIRLLADARSFYHIAGPPVRCLKVHSSVMVELPLVNGRQQIFMMGLVELELDGEDVMDGLAGRQCISIQLNNGHVVRLDAGDIRIL